MNTDTRHLSLATADSATPGLRLTDPRASRVLLVDDDRRRSHHLWASLGALSGDDTIAIVESADAALALIRPRPPAWSSWPCRSARVMGWRSASV